MSELLSGNSESVSALSRLFSTLSIRKLLIIGFGLPLTFNLLLMNVFFSANRDIKSYYAVAMHSKEILVYTKFLDLHLAELKKTVETGFTEESLLDPNKNFFSRLLRRLEYKVDALNQITKDNPEAQEILKQVQSRITEIGNLNKSLEMVPKAESLLAEIDELLKTLSEKEDDLDHNRTVEAKNSVDFEYNLLILALASNLIFYAVIAYMLRESFFKSLKRVLVNLQLAKGGEELELPTLLNSEISILENEFYDLYKKLKEKSSENEGFVYCVSHDLKSPLLNIQSFAKELDRSTEELERELHLSPTDTDNPIHNLISETRESLAFILSSSAKISQIINSLMGLSKAGRLKINIENLDLRLKIQHTLDSIEFDIRNAGAHIVVKDLPRIESDRAVVFQVFLNLITNSLKYREPSRNLEIEIGEDVSKSNSLYAAIYVKDNGMGIPPNYLERIFLPFEQIKKRNIPGEGLGLSIVKKLLERSNGKIEVESVEDKGTTFTVYFLKAGRKA